LIKFSATLIIVFADCGNTLTSGIWNGESHCISR